MPPADITRARHPRRADRFGVRSHRPAGWCSTPTSRPCSTSTAPAGSSASSRRTSAWSVRSRLEPTRQSSSSNTPARRRRATPWRWRSASHVAAMDRTSTGTRPTSTGSESPSRATRSAATWPPAVTQHGQCSARGLELAAQALFYPVTDANFDTASLPASSPTGLPPAPRRDAVVLGPVHTRLGQRARRSPPHRCGRPVRSSPTCPQALVITAEADVLRDEGEAYARNLRSAGVDVTATRYGGDDPRLHDAQRAARHEHRQGCHSAGDRLPQARPRARGELSADEGEAVAVTGGQGMLGTSAFLVPASACIRADPTTSTWPESPSAP